jgi:hypothetical protein
MISHRAAEYDSFVSTGNVCAGSFLKDMGQPQVLGLVVKKLEFQE